MNTTLLSNGEIKKALFDSYEEAQDYDDKGELFPEKHVARKQDLRTKSILADEVRVLRDKNPYKNIMNSSLMEARPSTWDKLPPSIQERFLFNSEGFDAALEAVLRLLEAKE